MEEMGELRRTEARLCRSHSPLCPRNRSRDEHKGSCSRLPKRHSAHDPLRDSIRTLRNLLRGSRLSSPRSQPSLAPTRQPCVPPHGRLPHPQPFILLSVVVEVVFDSLPNGILDGFAYLGADALYSAGGYATPRVRAVPLEALLYPPTGVLDPVGVP